VPDLSLEDWGKAANESAPADNTPMAGWLSSETENKRLDNSMQQGFDTQPDKAARVLSLQGKTGLPPDMINDNLDQIEKAAQVKDFNAAEFRKSSPIVANWLAAHPNHVAVARDDITKLSYMERQFKNISNSYEQGVMTNELANIGEAAMLGRATPEMRKRQQEIQNKMQSQSTYGITGFFEGIPGAMANQIPIFARTLFGKVKGSVVAADVGAASGATAALVAGQMGPQVATPEELVTVPAGAATGFTLGAVTGWRYGSAVEAGRLEASLAYLEFEQLKDEKGIPMDRNTALTAAAITGVINGGLEAFGAEQLINTIPGLRQLSRQGIKDLLKTTTVRKAFTMFAKNITKTMATEGATEFMQEMVKVAAGQLGLMIQDGTITHLSASDIMGRIFSDQNLANAIAEAKAGAQAGGGLSVAFGGLSAAQDVMRVKKAKQNQAFFKTIGATTQDTKLKDKLPEKMQELVHNMTKDGPVENLYVPVDSWNTYWQSQNVDPREVAKEVMGDTKAYDHAVDTQSDFPIPTSRYTTTIAPTEHNDFFANEMRTHPLEMNAREAQDWINQQDALDKQRAENGPVPQDVQAIDSAARVREDIKGQLLHSGFKNDTAEAYANLYESTFRTLGQRTGQDPHALFQQYNIKVRRPLPEILTKKTKVEHFAPILDQLRNNEIPTPQQVFGKSLVETLRSKGIQDTGGELAARNADAGRKPFERKLINDNGITLDHAAEIAAEKGFIARRDPNLLLDAIDQELRGKPVYSAGKLNTQLFDRRETLLQLQDYFDQLGVDVNSTDNNTLSDILKGNLPDQSQTDKNILFQQGSAAADLQAKLGIDPNELPIELSNVPGNRSQLQSAEDLLPTVGGGRAEQGWARATSVRRKDGRPAVVYRGAATNLNAGSFNADRLGGSTKNPSSGLGVWFTPERSDAASYGNVEQFYLDIRKPKVIKVEDLPGFDSVEHATAFREELRKQGYDGIAIDARHLEGPLHLVAFDPHQVVVPGKDNQVLYQSETTPAPVFYSKLLDVTEKLKQAKGTPDQFLAAIKKTPGVKEEELQWLGLEQWLKSQGKSVTRDQIAEYIRNNQVQLGEVLKGGPEQTALQDAQQHFVDVFMQNGWSERDAKDATIDAVRNSFTDAQLRQFTTEQKQAIDQLKSTYDNRNKNKVDPTKFDQYVLPGANNYREMLLTLPQREPDLPAGFDVKPFQGGWSVFGPKGEEGHGATRAEAISAFRSKSKFSNNDFRSSHFSEPNILAHIRFNDRVGANGEQILFIEEVQSDWHQQGRKRGYGARKANVAHEYKPGDFTITQSDTQWITHDINGVQRTVGKGVEPTEQGAREYFARWLTNLSKEYAQEQNLRPNDKVPDAPFKKTWPMLSMKRMIRYAAANGYDQIAWTNGEQQAARYDLSKQVSSITVEKALTNDGREYLAAYDHDGVRVINETIDPTELDQYIGKEAADKLRAVKPNENGVRELSGVDLKIGGDGMKAFYDGILPKEVNKYVKAWGAKVGKSTIKLPSDNLLTSEHLIAAAQDFHKHDYTLQDAKAGMQSAYPHASEVEIDNALKYFYPTESATVHSIDVTDKMRKSALQGQTLFQDNKKGKRGSLSFSRLNKNFTIDLLEKADLSTFLHETGHVYLEILGDLAQDPNASPQVQEDYQKVLDFLGVKSRDEIKTDQHEQWARAFEAYLFEGNAPTVELRSTFSRFRAWLIGVYHHLKNLNVNLTDNVRQVMDRLIATDEEIQNAEQQQNMQGLFTDAKQAGMTDQEFAKYQSLIKDARQHAEEELQRKAMTDISREQKQWWKDARAKIQDQVTNEVDSQKVYIALSVLQRGTLPDGSELPNGIKPIKLSRDTLIAAYGKAFLKRLPKPYVYAVEGGIHQDQAAEILGYNSGEELVYDLINARNRKQLIAAETTQRMREQYGDVLLDGRMPVEAMKVVHNTQRSEILMRELKALGNKTKRRITPLTIIRELADRTIREQRIRDINPYLYQRAEAKAARQAFEALAKNDTHGAILYKQIELLNHELYRKASKARELVTKITNYMQKFDKKSTRERIGKAGHDYLDQIDMILERYDFRKGISNVALDRRKSLLAWVQEQEDKGYSVDINEQVLNEAHRMHFKDTSFEELSGVFDSVRQIEHLARIKNKLLANKRTADRLQARDEIITAIAANHRIVPDPPDFAPGLKKRIVEKAKSLLAAHTKMEFLFEHLDGEKSFGVVWQHLFQPFVDAENNENKMMQGVVQSLNRVFSDYSRKERAQWFFKKTHIPEINSSMTKANMLAVALNWGNSYNRDALMRGYNWSQEQVQAVLKHLDKRDWATVQKIWDYIDTFWPQIETMEKQLNGVAPAKVEATTVETPYGNFRGGYYPIVFDSKLSWRQAQLDEKQSSKELFGGQWARAMTRRGHTKERTDTGGKPVRLDLSGMTEHLNNVVHDLAFRRPLIDVNGLATDKEVRQVIEAAAGREMYRQIQPWLRNIASDRREYSNPLEGILGRARMGATIVNMGWKMTTSLVQFLGYTVSIKELGTKYGYKGLADAYGNPLKFADRWNFITERSDQMKTRLRNYDRDVRDALKRLNVVGTKHGLLSLADAYTAKLKDSYFVFIGYMDLAVSIPTWLGAYRKAMDGAVENIDKGDEKAAIDYADQSVRITQGSGSAKDLALVQRGSETFRLFTMFYSYFSVLFNQFQKSGWQFKIDKNYGKLIGSMFLLWFIPAAMEDLLLGRSPDPGDDPQDWEKWLAKKELMYPFQSVVLMRDVVNGMDKYGYQPSAAFDAFESMSRTGQLGVKLLTGDKNEITRADVKGLAMTAGYAFGLPSRQIWLTSEYFYDWMTGEEQPNNPAEAAWRLLVTGKKRE